MSLFHVHGLISALLASLNAGAAIVCTPGFQAVSFFEWLEEFRPTWYTAAPAMHQAILGRAATNRDIISRSRLRFIRSGSAPMPPKLIPELERVFHVPLVEAYGMTETASTIASTPLPPGRRKPGSVGKATGCDIAVLDGTGAFLGSGQVGEIVVRGPNVTSGYENDHQANHSSFAPGGWLRTGDEGRIDADGYLFLTGRIREIINRGGEKISPREVDEALMDHPAVAQAMAFAFPDETLGEDIGAAVVLRDRTKAHDLGLEMELREFVAARLANFKVPRRVVFLDEIPRGRTGKPQRRGLAAALGLSEESAARHAHRPQGPLCAKIRSSDGPATPRMQTESLPAGNPESRNARGPEGVIETLLTQTWEDILGRRPIGRHEDFFDLGGDSLQGTRLLARVENVFGKEISLVSFFEAPTIARMAALLDPSSKSRSIAPSQIIPIRSSGSRPPLFFLTPQPIFRTLMLRLPEDQPVFGVSRPDFSRLPVPYRLEDLAAHYLEIIRHAHPKGPYALAGWCNDGVVAYEMAQQVLAQRGDVPLVAMIDSFVPASLRGEGRGAALIRRISYDLTSISTLDVKQLVEYIRRRSENVPGKIRAGYWLASYKFQLRTGLVLDRVLRNTEQIVRLAVREYHPRHLGGRVLLFRAQKRPAGPDPAFRWKDLVPDIEVVDVSGNHADIFREPNVEVMAEALNVQLRIFHHASASILTG